MRDVPKRTRHSITVQIEEQVESLDTTAIERAARAVLEAHELSGPCEIVIVLSDDASLHELNRRFRGIDGPTDVLSFADDTRGPFAEGGGDLPRYLGDVVISVERAAEQAQSAGGTVQQELQLLAVHGTLHLLGYDHDTDANKAAMWSVQGRLLDLLGIHIALPE